jgi:poly(3-hydroxybutyrate) depolymerase
MNSSTSLPLPTTPGLHDVTLPVSELTYKASIQVPANATGASLVMVLHYGGTPHGFYGRQLLEDVVASAWRDLHAVFIAPVSLGGDWTTALNTEMVWRLFASAESFYGTDTKRRVLTGYSLGAIGTWHFLAQKPDFFSAAVPMAGRVPEHYTPTSAPCFVLHSDADQLFPIDEVTARVAERAAHGADIRAEILHGVDHYAVTSFRVALVPVANWLQQIWARKN